MSSGAAGEDYRVSARRHWEQAVQAAAEARLLLTPPPGGTVSAERRAEAESLMRLAESYTGLTELALRLAGPDQDGER